MTTPEIDTSNQGDPNKLIWEGEPLSVEFLDVDIDPHRDTLSPIASTIRDASGVYMDCYFNDDSASFSSTGQVGINPECSNLTPAKIKRITRNTFNNLDFTLDDKMTGLTVTRRPEIYNLTVTDDDGANPHFFSVQYHTHNQAPSIFINSGHLSKEGKTINGYNDYQYTDAREHAKRHAEICAIIANSFLAKVGDSEQVKVLAKFPLGQVPSKELVVVPQPEYLQALENFPNYNDLLD